MDSKGYSKLMMFMAMSGMFMGGLPSGVNESYNKPMNEDDIRRLKEDTERIRKQQLLKHGCKEFHYDYRISETMFKEVTIIALNKKNADRKYGKFIKLWKESL